MKIGFIGLGIMGRPMAKNLVKAGHELVVFDFNKDAVADLVSCGATAAESNKDLAAQVDVVITMVPNSPHVRAAVLGENGVVEGAKEGFKITYEILPTLIGLMVAVGILRSSGALDILCNFLSPIADAIGFPKEALPITFMRLVSSSASTGILLDVFKNYGPDSFIGRFVSVMMSCTETIVYTMSLYFMSIKIKQTRYTLAGALVANFVGVIASLLICKALWG